MDKLSPGVGRGKGNATNVPERLLITEVKQRPLLYDKTVKDYRKPGVSDSAWNEVAVALDTSVLNCRKRWKSLRDTFIKYYRLEVLYSGKDGKRKQKRWNFYDELGFLKQHVELFRLEENNKDGPELSDTERCYTIEDETASKEVYELKMTDEEFDDETSYRIKEDHLLENYEEECSYEETLEQEGKTTESEYEAYEMENDQEELIEAVVEVSSISNEQEQFKTVIVPSSQAQVASPVKNIVDPDERYLMSCLPAFKRFTPQQKAYVRMGIERLFYEVEFEDAGQPKIKKQRTS